MAIEPFPSVGRNDDLNKVREALGDLCQTLDFLFDGGLDTLNIRRLDAKVITANTITAEKMNVSKLSAIAADLGHITAGLIEAVEIISSTITGSLIQTSESSYPRAEMRTTDTMFRAASDSSKKMELIANAVGYPAFVFGDGVGRGSITYGPDVSIGANRSSFQSDNGILIQAITGDVDLFTNSGNTKVNNWTRFVNRATGNSLQTDLNAKANASSYTGSFLAGTKTVTVVNGVIQSVV